MNTFLYFESRVRARTAPKIIFRPPVDAQKIETLRPFLGFKSHSMQPQGLELIRLSLANIELVKKIIQFSTVFSTFFDQ